MKNQKEIDRMVEELYTLYTKYGFDEEFALDKLVLDLKAAEADDINNQGVKEQIRYILTSDDLPLKAAKEMITEYLGVLTQ